MQANTQNVKVAHFYACSFGVVGFGCKFGISPVYYWDISHFLKSEAGRHTEKSPMVCVNFSRYSVISLASVLCVRKRVTPLRVDRR